MGQFVGLHGAVGSLADLFLQRLVGGDAGAGIGFHRLEVLLTLTLELLLQSCIRCERWVGCGACWSGLGWRSTSYSLAAWRSFWMRCTSAALRSILTKLRRSCLACDTVATEARRGGGGRKSMATDRTTVQREGERAHTTGAR